MTPEVRRKFNTAAGSCFILLGVYAWGMATFYAVKPKAPVPTPVVGTSQVEVNSCRVTLMRMGYQTKSTPQNDIEVDDANITDAEAQLQKATSAIGACKLPLKTFCMGRGCEQPGISFMLDGSKAAVDR